MLYSPKIALVVVCSLAWFSSKAQASIVTASLSANPASISEGGTTNLKLTVTHTLYPYRTFWYSESGGGVWRDYVTDGTGYISDVSGSINSGDGRTSSFSGSSSSNTYSRTTSIQYLSPGSYTASVTGTATFRDGVDAETWLFGLSGWRYYDTFNAGYYTHTESINATAQVNVNNLLPSITNMTWDAIVSIGDMVAFSLAGTDPYGVGATETMQWAYDLSGNGQYTDLIQTGSLSSSGTTSFSDPGIYTIGVRLADGAGGYAYNSFDVTVLAPMPEPTLTSTPEAASFAIWVGLASVAGLVKYRRGNTRSVRDRTHLG